MQFKEVIDQIIINANRYGKEYQVTLDRDFATTKLYEEVGEFAQALLIYLKKSRPEKFLPEDQAKEKLAAELADIIGVAILNAHILEIDIEKALEKKWKLKH